MTRGARALLAALLLSGALVVGLLGPAAQAPAAPIGTASVRLDVEALGPHVLRPGGTVAARATLHNDGPVPVTDLTVRLMAYSVRLPTREAVQAWAAGSSGIRAGNRFLADLPVDELAPGAAVAVELEAPAAELGLPGTDASWGPRGLTLEVLDAGRASFDQLTAARGFTVWDPREAPGPPAAVTVLVPLTAGPPAVDTGLVPATAMTRLTSRGGRLARVLEAASPRDVAWVVDPALLAAAGAPAERGTGPAARQPVTDTPTADPSRGPGTDPTTDPATGPATTDPSAGRPTTEPDAGADAPDPGPASDWLAAVQQAAVGRDVLTLPRSDPDLVGLAAAGGGDLYALATRTGRRLAADLLPSPATAEVAWPAAGAVDAAGLSVVADAGVGTVLLGAGAQPPADPAPATPTGRSTVRVGEERLDGLLADTGLSSTAVAATRRNSATLAASRLLAETAAISRGSDEQPHLLLALPRDWDPDPAAAADLHAALRSAPWLRRAPLRELLDVQPAVARDQVRLPGAERDAALPADGLQTVLGAVSRARRISSALTRPDAVLDPLERSAVAASAVAWRQDLPRWRAAVSQVAASASALAQAVHVLEGSAVNVVSSQVDLPVTVANELPQDVRAVVSVRPRSSRLVAEDEVEVSLGPESTERVAVPVRALANGDTDVVVSVRAPDGAPLGRPVTVRVRVRADWETRGILVAGAVLAGVLVVGLARTIRRGRRRDVPDRGEAAAAREDG